MLVICPLRILFKWQIVLGDKGQLHLVIKRELDQCKTFIIDFLSWKVIRIIEINFLLDEMQTIRPLKGNGNRQFVTGREAEYNICGTVNEHL